MEQKTRYLQIALGAALLLVGATFLLSFRTGHPMNGDYALYICQAQKLSAGEQWQAYRDMADMLNLSTDRLYSPILYPWGLPLLLVLPYLLTGINYTAFKIVVMSCVPVTLFLLYRLFKVRHEFRYGAWVLLLTSLNTTILSTERIISTLPYLMFLVLSLLLIHRWQSIPATDRKRQRKTAVVLGLSLFFTIQTRTEGILLFPVMLVQLLANRTPGPLRKSWPDILLPCGVCLFLFLLTLPYLPVGYLVHADHTHSMDFSITDNLRYYLTTIPANCLPFLPKDNVWTAGGFWLLTGLGMWEAGRKALAEQGYIILHLLLLLTWPHQTERYAIPLIPLLLYFTVTGLYALSRPWMRKGEYATGGILFFLTCCLLLHQGIELATRQKEYDDINLDVTGQSAQEMIAFLNEHAAADDIIACGESRTIYLYTGRLSCNLSASAEDTAAKANWYVLFRNRFNYLQHWPKELSDRPDLFHPVFENKDFIIYQTQRP
ncbi:MAG: hypothetical protein J6K41_04715 [Paraprevotella sp.]|nr:hypothetical protein [Paraprevotella sp.]